MARNTQTFLKKQKLKSCDNCLRLKFVQLNQFEDYHLQCSRNYGSPTRVNKFKVALNMEDPISLRENRTGTAPLT